MTRRSITVQQDDFEEHNERRKAAGLTWPAYLERAAWALEAGVGPTAGDVPEQTADAVVSRLTEEGGLADEVADAVAGEVGDARDPPLDYDDVETAINTALDDRLADAETSSGW